MYRWILSTVVLKYIDLILKLYTKYILNIAILKNFAFRMSIVVQLYLYFLRRLYFVIERSLCI